MAPTVGLPASCQVQQRGARNDLHVPPFLRRVTASHPAPAHAFRAGLEALLFVLLCTYTLKQEIPSITTGQSRAADELF